MYSWDVGLYIGNENEQTSIGFLTAENFFLVVRTVGDIQKADLDDLLAFTKKEKSDKPVGSLADLESLIDGAFKRLKSFGEVSIVSAAIVDDILYVLSRGHGCVYMSRGSMFDGLIDGDLSSSGRLQDGDSFLLAMDEFVDRMGKQRLYDVFNRHLPQQAIDEITPELKSKDDTGLVAMYVHVTKNARGDVDQTELADDEGDEMDEEGENGVGDRVMEAEVVPDVEGAAEAEPIQPVQPVQPTMPTPAAFDGGSNKKGLSAWLGMLEHSTVKGRKYTALIVVVLLVILGWSVVLGNQRREKEAFAKHLTQEKTIVMQRISEAGELAGTDSVQALAKIAEAQQTVDKLSLEATNKKFDAKEDIASMRKAIADAEKAITKKEEGRLAVFYDMEVIDETASAEDLAVDGDDLVFLDRQEGKIYIVSSEKKSVDIRTHKLAKEAKYVAMHQGDPYIFVPAKGVFSLDEDNKEKNVIPNDEEWGDITDMDMYSGNIYLLDSGKSDVYKYLVAENGYSDKNPYFKLEKTPDLKGAERIAIDGALYVAEGDGLTKYESGLNADFDGTTPNGDVSFNDVFAKKEIDDVYVLDREHGAVVIFDKDGVFKKQKGAAKMKDAQHIIFAANKILVQIGTVVYEVKE